MERREAPGRCATAPLPGARCVKPDTERALLDGVASPVRRRARPAVAGLRGPPSGRCASRRSTAGLVVGDPLPLAAGYLARRAWLAGNRLGSASAVFLVYVGRSEASNFNFPVTLNDEDAIVPITVLTADVSLVRLHCRD